MDARNTELSETADLFRKNYSHITKGISKLSLSTKFIAAFQEIFDAFDPTSLEESSMTSSFHMSLNSNKAELKRDLLIISDIFHKSVTLKLILESRNDDHIVDISRFKSLRYLELHKVKVKNVGGIQKLRAQIQKLACTNSISALSDILEKSGLDNSSGLTWHDLKEAAFPHNELTELDTSLDYTPWLHTLDLSYNLLTTATPVSVLCNLKHLNLAYNKFLKVPHFSGLICNRLQTLILKNNFVEDIEPLIALSNIVELDLSDNCLVDHKSLVAISHLASLQMLNLEGNPLSFHPQHRTRTCSYLHKNTATVCFVLDHIVLTKSEKSVVGSLHPIIHRPQLSLTNSFNGSVSLPSEGPRRVRNVVIQEGDTPVKTPTRSPNTFTGHLETKRQIEYLREQYGTSWLQKESGLIVSDVLGLEKSGNFLSSTPKSDDVYASDNLASSPEDIKVSNDDSAATDNAFRTASEETLDDKEDEVSVYSEDEDINEGDECIYFCNIDDQNQEILLVVTETHISERDCITSKQKARWHINTVVKCEIVNEEGTQVQLDFDTLRRDRQKRLYNLEKSEAERLVVSLNAKKDIHRVEEKLTMYQCMKCSLKFTKKNNSFHNLPVSCPCGSNLIIECNCD